MSRQAKRAAATTAAATKDALIELVREALGAKIATDLGRPTVALAHLDTLAALTDGLRTSIHPQPTTPHNTEATS